jgi:gas vesicle protein
MTDRNGSLDRFMYLLIGASIGAGLALLFAPKAGRELRGDIAELSRKGMEKGRDAAHRVTERVSEGVDTVRETAARQKTQLSHAIDAGKQAYREERDRA